MASNRSRPRAADVFIRALPSLESFEELTDLCSLAAAHYGARLPEDLERAIKIRQYELARAGSAG